MLDISVLPTYLTPNAVPHFFLGEMMYTHHWHELHLVQRHQADEQGSCRAALRHHEPRLHEGCDCTRISFPISRSDTSSPHFLLFDSHSASLAQ
ncbi:uncharacterized protein BO72DRAFT_38426 [Aspergillus fijiensis CBS 313.89]|uniref:Uncharacterized protein n=1 Tax=Aspergillus fijiensis CBS 313.89 TaxID=1448319 RepID=A0A8G1REQ1_9EURO|nr:uncharacterized protein BO72DRAFT_38426 [Aspergillus fijiensis CBS 313.89]RAK70992.1 hypothetical protein BO72DRAFT_38426 [Aspergillus fijiensis CBS 313.89]